MPDDHSKLVPLLPIPNRTVKRLRADDSAGSRVKVGHRQALTAQTALQLDKSGGRFALGIRKCFLRTERVRQASTPPYLATGRTSQRLAHHRHL